MRKNNVCVNMYGDLLAYFTSACSSWPNPWGSIEPKLRTTMLDISIDHGKYAVENIR